MLGLRRGHLLVPRRGYLMHRLLHGNVPVKFRVRQLCGLFIGDRLSVWGLGLFQLCRGVLPERVKQLHQLPYGALFVLWVHELQHLLTGQLSERHWLCRLHQLPGGEIPHFTGRLFLLELPGLPRRHVLFVRCEWLLELRCWHGRCDVRVGRLLWLRRGHLLRDRWATVLLQLRGRALSTRRQLKQLPRL